MNLVFIYGPPGVGKLTVARELSRATGCRVFHNHLSIDCVLPVFEFGTRPFGRAVNKIRFTIFKEAAREGLVDAKAVLVGSRHTAESLWAAMPLEGLVRGRRRRRKGFARGLRALRGRIAERLCFGDHVAEALQSLIGDGAAFAA